MCVHTLYICICIHSVTLCINCFWHTKTCKDKINFNWWMQLKNIFTTCAHAQITYAHSLHLIVLLEWRVWSTYPYLVFPPANTNCILKNAWAKQELHWWWLRNLPVHHVYTNRASAYNFLQQVHQTRGNKYVEKCFLHKEYFAQRTLECLPLVLSFLRWCAMSSYSYAYICRHETKFKITWQTRELAHTHT